MALEGTPPGSDPSQVTVYFTHPMEVQTMTARTAGELRHVDGKIVDVQYGRPGNVLRLEQNSWVITVLANRSRPGSIIVPVGRSGETAPLDVPMSTPLVFLGKSTIDDLLGEFGVRTLEELKGKPIEIYQAVSNLPIGLSKPLATLLEVRA